MFAFLRKDFDFLGSFKSIKLIQSMKIDLTVVNSATSKIKFNLNYYICPISVESIFKDYINY